MNAGEKGSFWKHSGAEGGIAQRWLERRDVATSRRPHVVTSQRHDVGSTYIEVNKRQRRDVAMSRRQREFCLSIIKSKKGTRIRGIGDRGWYELWHGNQNSSDFDIEEEPIICIFLLIG